MVAIRARFGYESGMASAIPRRPQTPGAPGIGLPPARGLARSAREVVTLRPPDDDETTLPNGSAPPESGIAVKSLSVGGLTKPEAGQLAGIIAAWESADEDGRKLLADLAQRLAKTRQK